MSFSVCFLALEYFGWGKYGGIGRVTRDIASGLAGKGVDVSVIVPRGRGQAEFETIEGVKIHSFPLSGYYRIGSIIEKVNADIYHSQDPTPGTYIALKKMRRSRQVLTCQNPKTRDNWKKVNGFYGLRRRLFNRVFEPSLGRWLKDLDAVFCQANYIRGKAEELYSLDYTPGFLPNPVKVPDFVAEKEMPLVCYLSRFDGEKRPERLFDLCTLSQKLSFKLFVITNQAGIGRGYYTVADYEQLTEWMLEQFTARGICIQRVYYCPYHPTAGIGEYRQDSFDRKPNPGMILKARII